MSNRNNVRYIIRNLPRDVSETDILSLLNKDIDIHQIKIIDKPGSLPFCHVDVFDCYSTEKFMYSLNGSIFKGNRIAVTPYLSSSEYEDAIKRTIIISGFDDDFSFIYIYTYITKRTSVWFMFPNFKYDGTFSGSISVVLTSEDICPAAIRLFNNKQIGKYTVTCTQYKADFKKSISLNLHIRNIPLTWADEDLKSFCAQFGEIVSCIRIQKSETFVHGFVSYKEKESLEKALEFSKNKTSGILFEEYQSVSERQRAHKQEIKKTMEKRDKACAEHRVIFVGHLPAKMTEVSLRKDFANCGTIEEISLSKDKRNNNKQRAYITFDSEDSAKKGLAVLGKKAFVDRKIYGSMASPSKSVPTVLKKNDILSLNEKMALTEDHLQRDILMWDSFSDYLLGIST